jgi:hypothetical protein
MVAVLQWQQFHYYWYFVAAHDDDIHYIEEGSADDYEDDVACCLKHTQRQCLRDNKYPMSIVEGYYIEMNFHILLR